MIKVGLTGGIGSGKTTVAKIFELLEIPVYYSDIEAKKLLNEDKQIQEAIIRSFGQVYLSKKINNKKLASIVFNDENKLQTLNNIVHPAVNNHFDKWVDEHSAYKYIIKEAAILFESGSHKNVDKIITVTAPFEIKIERVCKRDNISEKEVLARIDKQWSDEEKIKLSDFLIHNDNQNMIIPQIIEIHQKLIL